MIETELGIFIVFKFVHHANAPLGIEVTNGGITTSDKLLHSEKTDSPISETDDGMDIDKRFSQFINNVVGKLFIFSDNFTLLRLLQYKKALRPISFIEFGILTVFSVEQL